MSGSELKGVAESLAPVVAILGPLLGVVVFVVQNHIKGKNREIDELKQSLAGARSDIEKAIARTEQEAAAKSAAAHDKMVALGRIAGLEVDLAREREGRERADEKVNELNQSWQQALHHGRELERNLDAAAAKAAFLQRSLDDTTTAYNVAVGDRDAFRAERDETQRKLGDSQANAAALDSLLREARERLAVTRAELQAAETDRDTARSERDDLQFRVDKEKNTSSGLRKAVKEAQAEVVALTATVTAVEGERDGFRVERDAARGERDEVQKTLDAERATAADLDRKSRETAGRLVLAETAARSLVQQLNAARAELAAARSELVTERAAAADLRAQHKEATGRLASVGRLDGRVWQHPVAAAAPRFAPRPARKPVVVSVLNLKGGVGKTTITANLMGLYGEAGKRVLGVDLDHQRSLSLMLLSTADREKAVGGGKAVQQILLKPNGPTGSALINAADKVTGAENTWIVTCADLRKGEPPVPGLDDVEMRLMARWLVNRPAGTDARFLLRNALHSADIQSHFDIVFLDCPPRLTTACVNAVAASDVVLIPVQAEAVALASVKHLVRHLDNLRRGKVLSDKLALGVVANMVPNKNNLEESTEAELFKWYETELTRQWAGPVRFFRTMLTRLNQYADATVSLDAGGDLKLAIAYGPVRKQFENLQGELEELVDAGLRPSNIPA